MNVSNCEECGVVLGHECSPGYPRFCSACARFRLHKRIAELEVEDEKKKRDIQYLTAKRVELEDERDIFKRTLDKRDKRIAELEKEVAELNARRWRNAT